MAQSGMPNVAQPAILPPTGRLAEPWFRFLYGLWRLLGAGHENTVFVTGDLKSSASSAAQPGWLACNGDTLGDASSGATAMAGIDAQALFILLWNAWPNTALPIQDSTGAPSVRGLSAEADFNAHKRLPTPDLRGRFLMGVSGSHTLGAGGGTETATLTVAMLPAHTHSGGAAGGSAAAGAGGDGATVADTGSTGSGDPVPILPPYTAVAVFIKT